MVCGSFRLVSLPLNGSRHKKCSGEREREKIQIDTVQAPPETMEPFEEEQIYAYACATYAAEQSLVK